ncbi:hypothetical protein F4808DRAFT_326446 [Astrocystis sublimbata]|nr:hypothetical protein F4808DRAFT_326446 [Astrocystis sublimbata]
MGTGRLRRGNRPMSELRKRRILARKPNGPSNGGNGLHSVPAKRLRALDDVDGPGTAKLPMKKRRLLLQFVTSRLSLPFSLPATNILIRECGDKMPVLHRIQHSFGARRAGHQSALFRKAAIMNRVRIGVRTAAITRGHIVMADIAARRNALNHGLWLVTTPVPTMVFPSSAIATKEKDGGNGTGGVPAAWRPHTTSFQPPVAHAQYRPQQQRHSPDATHREDPRNDDTHEGGHSHGTTTTPMHPHAHRKESPSEQQRVLPRPRRPSSVPLLADNDASDDEEHRSLSPVSFQDRYIDFSDDDMDDVYADFGVLFGSAARSPETPGAVGTPTEEQFYEEYLDELDGIHWVF